MPDTILNLGEGATQEKAFVTTRTTDPVIIPQPYSSPADYAAQYPVPLDTTEILAMCEEVTLLKAIPEEMTALKQDFWREMTTLEFTSGSAYLSFQDGSCPEEYTHDGANKTVDIKNIGAKKSLSIRDIKQSQAIAAANWNGINALNGPAQVGEGLPGGNDVGTMQRKLVGDVKAKEIALASTLVLNGEDRLIVQGNHVNNSLEFTGFENWATNYSCTMHTPAVSGASGTFSAAAFDRFLSEGCAKPTALFGHPQAIQELMSAYYQLGFAGSQVIQYTDGTRLVPGFNFAAFVNTGIGRLPVYADNNFRRDAAGAAAFQGDIWAMRMTHNGEPLVYRKTQIAFGIQDLVPGCTAISFMVWKATALIIKQCCAHGKYTALFSGSLASTCTLI